jgi:hypothetical protein
MEAHEAPAQQVEQAGIVPGNAAVRLERGAARAGTHNLEWVAAEEGIAGEAFASLHAFQQEGARGLPAGSELQERADRSEQVGRQNGANGYEVALGGQLSELCEVGGDHASLPWR